MHSVDSSTCVSREKYTVDLETSIREAHMVLWKKQLDIWTDDREEPPFYKVSDSVIMVSKQRKKGQSKKLQPKYVGPYIMMEVWPTHTYRVQSGNQTSVENEVRLKLYRPSSDPVGQAPVKVQPTRGPNRKGVGRG